MIYGKEIKIEQGAIASILYRNPKIFSRSDNGQIIAGQTGIPVIIGTMQLPRELDALVITSDLQGTIEVNGALELMGLLFPEILAGLIPDLGLRIDLNRTGVALCGDLYAHKKKRGGYGDVSEVWRAFKKRFTWVAGVQGNHDLFGSKENKRALFKEEGIFLLDHISKHVDGLRIAGLGQVIGNTKKPNRRSAEEYLEKLSDLLTEHPDVLILHAAPYIDAHHIGDPQITDLLKTYQKDLLVFCGHEKWATPLKAINEHVNVLNVDERVLILLNSKVVD